MSQDDIKYKRKNVIHYGSLEDTERQRLKSVVEGGAGPSSSAGGNANINISTSYERIIPEAKITADRQNALEEFERRRRARQIAVSTDDIEVRAHLRNLNQPICLFGEGPGDRRERLRQLLARMGDDAIKRIRDEDRGTTTLMTDEKEPNKTWYHIGSQELLEARYWIADYSLPRAKQRLEMSLKQKDVAVEVREAGRQDLYKKLRSMEIGCSQVADQRPISSCHFSPNGKMIATSSWSGLCKIWTMPDLKLSQTLRAHNNNVDDIRWHPKATIDQSAEALNAASCGVDGFVYLWSLASEEPLARLDGHKPNRVSHLDFHPSGRFLATCCYDNSWRLWDIEACEELLHQEGHVKPVHDASFNTDGSLLASGGRDSFGRVWDLRTGRCIMTLEDHLKGIISIAFSPDGYHIVTGSEDNTIKIWNLRQKKLEYTIAAHTNIVSKVRFEKNVGNYIISSSYDNSIKLWAHPAWTPIATLSGHDNKVMGIDMSNDNAFIISSSFDRTFKLWERM